MPLVPLALGSGSNVARHGFEGAARHINCHLEQIGEEGKHGEAIYAVDGWRAFATLVNGADVRAMLTVGSTLYAVAGRLVYAVDLSGTATHLGTIAVDGLVTMAANRKAPNPQIAIVCGGLYYLVENNILTQVNDADLPAPVAVLEADGYFIFIIQDGRFFISEINDGLTITALDFAKAEALSDPLVMGATRGRDICLFGTRSLEFWQNTGGADFPFSRVNAANIGCLAAGSVAEVTAVINGATVDSIAWAATDEQGGYLGVMLLNGYAGLKISTHQVDRDIQSEPSPAAIRAFTWSRKGHVFYAITGTGFTHVYNTVTGRWHERASYGLSRWRASCHAKLAGMDLFGDYDANRIYRMTDEDHDEAGEPLVMTVQTPPIHAFPGRLQFHELHVDVVPGVGRNSSDPAQADPKLMIDWSDDGGHHWSTQRQESLGAEGERLKRVVSRRMGVARSRTYRLSCSAAVVRGLMNAQINIERLGP
jgi:hypothetical protein